MRREKSGNGFISFLLILIILLMLIFGSILTGLVQISNPILTLGKAKIETHADLKEENTNTVSNENYTTNTTAPVMQENEVTTNTVNSAASIPNVENTTSSENVVTQKSSVPTTQILDYYSKRLSSTDNMYSIADINDDKIPELFVFTTGTYKNTILAETFVYTYDENTGDKTNNYIVFLGQISGRVDTNTEFYKMNDGRLLKVYGHMGYEETTYYRLTNDWLVREEFSSREIDEKSGEDYISGDVKIEFKKVSDKSLLKNYKD